MPVRFRPAPPYPLFSTATRDCVSDKPSFFSTGPREKTSHKAVYQSGRTNQSDGTSSVMRQRTEDFTTNNTRSNNNYEQNARAGLALRRYLNGALSTVTALAFVALAILGESA